MTKAKLKFGIVAVALAWIAVAMPPSDASMTLMLASSVAMLICII